MEKKLVAKTQKILPKVPQYTRILSGIITSTPEDEEVLKKKGTVYGVFEVSGPMEFETSVISKTVSDVLQDSYFQSDNISPVQSLEKAILNTKEKLTKLSENTLREKSSDLKLDITAAVLWGNVLYIVKHGGGNAIIMREGETKPVSFLVEGNFSSASGIVKNDDVVVISTTSFGTKFPPAVLLRAGSDTFQELPPESSCLMIKFSIETAFTPNEQIDFGLKKRKTTSIGVGKLKDKLLQKGKSKKPNEGIVSITGPGKRLSGGKIKKILIPVLLIGFTISVVLTVKGVLGKKEEEPTKTVVIVPEEKTEVTPPDTDKDESFFYDLTLVEDSVTPTGILVTEEKVLVSDKATGKLYVSNRNTPQFSPIESQYFGIGDMVLKDDVVNFKDKDGYRTYDLATGTSQEVIKVEGLNITFPYLDFVYELKGDTLYKYAGTEDKAVWAQSSDFSNAVSMVIDMSIYILNDTGEVFKYTSGEKDAFELQDMDIDLNAPTGMVLAPESDALYIADSGNKSVVVIDMKGNFKQRIYHQDKETWGEIRGISVSPEGDKLFVLNGTSVYEVAL